MKTVGCVYSSKPASYKSTRKASDMAFIYYLTQIQIDFGAINLLAAECERVGIRRPLIVTDPGVKAVGILQTLFLHAQIGGGDDVIDGRRKPVPYGGAIEKGSGSLLDSAELARVKTTVVSSDHLVVSSFA